MNSRIHPCTDAHIRHPIANAAGSGGVSVLWLPRTRDRMVMCVQGLNFARFFSMCFFTVAIGACASTEPARTPPPGKSDPPARVNTLPAAAASQPSSELPLFRAVVTRVSTDRFQNVTVYLRFESKATQDIALFSVRTSPNSHVCLSQLTDTSGNRYLIDNDNCSIPLSDPIVEEVPTENIIKAYKVGLRLPAGRAVPASFQFHALAPIHPEARFTFSSTLQIAYPTESGDPGWRAERLNILIENIPRG